MRLLRLALICVVVLWLLGRIHDGVTSVFGDGSTTAVLGVVLITVAAVAVAERRLRREQPWLWWPLFGAPIAVVRMAWTWRASCEELGLSIPAKRFSNLASVGGVLVKGEAMKLISPRRVRMRFNGCGLLLTVRLHPGQTPADWDKSADAFSHQWRVHRVRVESTPGFVTLTGLGFDPLRFPPPPPPESFVEGSGDGSGVAGPGSGPGLDLDELPVVPSALIVEVGIREDGSPWVIDLTAWAHYLVTGATRSGKSTLTVRFLSELIRRPVAIVGIDCKGGLELSPFAARLSALATSRREAAAAIEALVGEMELRMLTCHDLHARNIWEIHQDVRPKPVVVVVDEVAELFLYADKEGKEEAARCVTGLVRLAQLGAGLGIHLWISGQRFGSDLGPGATLLRAQLSGRICHRVADEETAKMTLAGLPGEAIDEALMIGADLAGVAVLGDGSGQWALGRSYPSTVAEAVHLAESFAPLVVPMPEVTACIRQAAIGSGR